MYEELEKKLRGGGGLLGGEKGEKGGRGQGGDEESFNYGFAPT